MISILLFQDRVVTWTAKSQKRGLRMECSARPHTMDPQQPARRHNGPVQPLTD